MVFFGRLAFLFLAGLGFAAVEHRGDAEATPADQQQRNPRQAGEHQDRQKAARHRQRLRPRKQLPQELVRQVTLCVLRVTSKPAASEIKNAGTWLTRPSPIVSRV